MPAPKDQQGTHRFGISEDIRRARARLDDLDPSRELALVATKLEEAALWFAVYRAKVGDRGDVTIGPAGPLEVGIPRCPSRE